MTTQVTLDNCEREPIHIPGAVQPHGVLLACRGDSLSVTQISANAASCFGRSPDDILGKPLADLFADAFAETIRDLGQRTSLRDANPVHLDARDGTPLEAVLHRSGASLVVEVERRVESQNGSFDPRLRRSIVKLSQARAATELSQIAADEVRALTGFDRVMVYRFDPEWNGQVVAEARREDLEPFLGLHYPASDIPAQARRLYTQNWLRLIGDVGYTPARLVPELDPETRAPLDLSHAHLRSVSPIHIEYLRNMGVSASMSISLIADGDLIGLIACHHYSGPRVVSYVIRETAEYLGQALSWNLRVLQHADETERAARVQKCEAEIASSLALADELREDLAVPALLELASAAGAAVVLDEGVRTIGKTPGEAAIHEIVTFLRGQPDDVLATEHLASRYAPAAQWDGVAAGLLATTLSRELGEYLLWFRPSTERTVDWAGDPRKQTVPGEPGEPPRLSPRGSFALWRETVRGRALPWERWQIEAASNIRRLLLGGARRRAATLKALNQRLMETDRAKDVFIATVSHELRNPLNAITGWSGMALAGELPEDRRDEAMAVVSRNAETLTRLVDDLLDVARITSGKLVLEVTNVDVASIVETAILGNALAAEAKHIRIKRILESSSMTILGDGARIRQVVMNLLTNAIKFTPKNGSITVTLRRQGSDLELAVHDSGAGIEQSQLPHVFNAFWQADSSLKRRSQGLGLGLAIAKKLVELHGGTITAESQGLGQGSTFRARFPIASARQPEEPEPRAPAPRISKPLAGLRIIVAEDESDSRFLLQNILQIAGAQVRAAANATETLALLASEPCDVLVSDIGMPDMDGLEMIARLRADTTNRGAKVPAVALTAYTRSSDRTAALRAGFQAHVPKPADREELVTVVASVVKRI